MDRRLFVTSLLMGTASLGLSSQAFGQANDAEQEHDLLRDTKGTFRITLKSYSVIDTPVTDPAVHNELTFYWPDGEVFQTINGHPFDRTTGEIDLGLGENKTLRVIQDSEKDYEALSGEAPISEMTLWEGGIVEFYDKVFRSREAASYINTQKLDYIMFDAFRAGQNSNSVAYSVARYAGLDYPPEAEALWAPGHGRYLLPEGFVSFFDRFPVTTDTFYDFLPPQGKGESNGIHDDYTSLIFERLRVKDIQEDVAEEGINTTGQPLRVWRPQDALPSNPLGSDYYRLVGKPEPALSTTTPQP